MRFAHVGLSAQPRPPAAARLAVVKTFFRQDGRLKAPAAKTQMELGFQWACEYGHTRVVAFLLRHGVDVRAQPHGETALHWAAYGGHAEIVRLILRKKPPLEIKDRRFGGTPLTWALHGWRNPSPEPGPRDYHQVVAQLVAAGALVNPKWLASGDLAQHLRTDPLMRAALKL